MWGEEGRGGGEIAALLMTCGVFMEGMSRVGALFAAVGMTCGEEGRGSVVPEPPLRE